MLKFSSSCCFLNYYRIEICVLLPETLLQGNETKALFQWYYLCCKYRKIKRKSGLQKTKQRDIPKGLLYVFRKMDKQLIYKAHCGPADGPFKILLKKMLNQHLKNIKPMLNQHLKNVEPTFQKC